MRILESSGNIREALSQYVAKSDPGYRLTGFYLAPYEGISVRLLSLYLENEEGWGEVVHCHVGKLGANPARELAALCSELNACVAKEPPPERYGSENNPIILKEESTIERMIEAQLACMRETAGHCRLVRATKLREWRGNEDRFLEALSVEDERGRSRRFHFDMTHAYDRLHRGDLRGILAVESRYDSADKATIIERDPVRRDLADEIVINSLPPYVVRNLESLHGELLLQAELWREGFRIRGFTPLFIGERAENFPFARRTQRLQVAMHLENGEGWKTIRFVEFFSGSRERDASSINKLLRALDAILERTPPFSTPYAGAGKNPIHVGAVESASALERILRLALEAQCPDCRLLSGARYLLDPQGRFLEAVTVEDRKSRLRKNIFFDLTDAYAGLLHSQDPDTRQKVAAWKARHQPWSEPAHLGDGVAAPAEE